VLTLIIFLFFSDLSRQAIVNLERELGSVTEGAILQLILVWLAVLLTTLRFTPDWDLEWLITLPLRLPTLLAIRLVESTVADPLALASFAPFLTLVAWHCGFRWSAPALGLALSLILLSSIAVVRICIDTAVRVSLPPSVIRNLQALLTIAGTLMAYLSMAIGLARSGRSFVMDWATQLPGWVRVLPPGLAIEVLTSTNQARSASAFLLLSVEAFALCCLGLLIVARQLARGVVGGGIRESTRQSRPIHRDHQTSPRWFLSPVQSRELRLLARDRNFLVQTLILPVVFIATQWSINTGHGAFAELFARYPGAIAAAAFSIAAYGLLFSALQTLNAEGQALWILYTVPRRLEVVLREKATLWSCLSLAFPTLILAWGFHQIQGRAIELVGLAGVVLVGVPMYAVIATALGVFACNPLAPEVFRRVRVSYVYMYMGLASLYGYALYTEDVWQRGVAIVLTLVLALSLWQKAKDHLPFLLDPAASPPAQVSLSDGVIAAVVFFIFQGIALVVSGKPMGEHLLTAFVFAGAITYGITRLIYWRTRALGVPRLWGPAGIKGIGLGLTGGLLAACGAVAYLHWIVPLGFFDVPAMDSSMGSPLWLVVLAVVAAPIFEEFIFRGLIHGGLRRSVGVAPAILASGIIFALVHPPIAALPVFGLGVCAAFVYERTRMLAAPMMAHAVYNLIMISGLWAR